MNKLGKIVVASAVSAVAGVLIKNKVQEVQEKNANERAYEAELKKLKRKYGKLDEDEEGIDADSKESDGEGESDYDVKETDDEDSNEEKLEHELENVSPKLLDIYSKLEVVTVDENGNISLRLVSKKEIAKSLKELQEFSEGKVSSHIFLEVIDKISNDKPELEHGLLLYDFESTVKQTIQKVVSYRDGMRFEDYSNLVGVLTSVRIADGENEQGSMKTRRLTGQEIADEITLMTQKDIVVKVDSNKSELGDFSNEDDPIDWKSLKSASMEFLDENKGKAGKAVNQFKKWLKENEERG